MSQAEDPKQALGVIAARQANLQGMMDFRCGWADTIGQTAEFNTGDVGRWLITCCGSGLVAVPLPSALDGNAVASSSSQ